MQTFMQCQTAPQVFCARLWQTLLGRLVQRSMLCMQAAEVLRS